MRRRRDPGPRAVAEVPDERVRRGTPSGAALKPTMRGAGPLRGPAVALTVSADGLVGRYSQVSLSWAYIAWPPQRTRTPVRLSCAVADQSRGLVKFVPAPAGRPDGRGLGSKSGRHDKRTVGPAEAHRGSAGGQLGRADALVVRTIGQRLASVVEATAHVQVVVHHGGGGGNV